MRLPSKRDPSLVPKKPTWRTMPIAGLILEPGTSKEYFTGDWRSERPLLDDNHCTKCGICWVYCPEGAIEINEKGAYEINLKYCKGCGICATECSPKAIKMEAEPE